MTQIMHGYFTRKSKHCESTDCMADALFYVQYAPESPTAVRRGHGERKELRYVMEWLSRHDGNGHGKQIKDDYGRRAEGG